MWLPVHDDEWDGDMPLALEPKKATVDPETGHVVFKGDTVPWQVGTYEVSPVTFAELLSNTA